MFAACTIAYFLMHESGWLFALLILAPDVGMIGYGMNTKLGSMTYNFFHTEIWPVTLAFIGGAFGWPLIPIALIWISHIALDRFLGFGLKYATRFDDTHIQRV